jgi:hypothetical protein
MIICLHNDQDKKQEFESISLNEVECGLLEGEKEGEDAHLVDDPDVSIGLELCAPIDSSAGGRINSLGAVHSSLPWTADGGWRRHGRLALVGGCGVLRLAIQLGWAGLKVVIELNENRITDTQPKPDLVWVRRRIHPWVKDQRHVQSCQVGYLPNFRYPAQIATPFADKYLFWL